MDVKEIKRLLDALAASEVHEFVYETGEYKMTVRRGGEQVVVTQAPQAAAPERAPEVTAAAGLPSAPAAPPPVQDHGNYAEVVAPIVGTFYASPAPDAPPYVKVGDRVQKGAVLCIIEAMKLMNEIEAETAGTVREILVQNEEPVEYGQVLFRIEPA